MWYFNLFQYISFLLLFLLAFVLSSSDGMSNIITQTSGKPVILFSSGFCRKYFRFTVLIKALYFLQALVFIERWIMPENITAVRLELWEHQPHHTWWICPLKYGPGARPYKAPQCGLTICRRKREEDGGLRGRVEERNISQSVSRYFWPATNLQSQ